MTTGVARVRYRVKGRPGVYVLPFGAGVSRDAGLLAAAREIAASDDAIEGWAIVAFRPDGRQTTAYRWPDGWGPVDLLPGLMERRLHERIINGT